MNAADADIVRPRPRTSDRPHAIASNAKRLGALKQTHGTRSPVPCLLHGPLKRILVKDGNSGYADIVFFADAAAIDRVIEAEQNSEVCAAFFAIMDSDGTHTVYEVLKPYDR